MPISSASLYYHAGEFASAFRAIFGTGRPLRGAVVLRVAMRTAVCFTASPVSSGQKLSVGFADASGAFGQQFADDHEVVGEHRGGNEQSEALGAFGAATLHAAAAHQYRDAPLNAGTEALALLECRRSFVVPALRRLAAATLRDRDRGDAAVHAQRHIALAEEAAIGAVELRGAAENAAMALERRRHMNLVHRISFEHLILGDQTLGAFGEENFAWTLDRRCKSSAERVGSNRKPKATARRRECRETIRLGAARPCGKEAGRRAAAPNESEASDRPGRSGERAKERDAQNPTEIGAVLRTGAAVHPVSLPWEVCMGPRKR